MKCIICHGESIERKTVREERLTGNDILVIPIEVLECSTCGERYYDRKARRYMESVDQQLHAGNAVTKDIGRVRILAT